MCQAAITECNCLVLAYVMRILKLDAKRLLLHFHFIILAAKRVHRGKLRILQTLKHSGKKYSHAGGSQNKTKRGQMVHMANLISTCPFEYSFHQT